MKLAFFAPMAHVPTVAHQEQGVRVVRGKPVFYDTPEIKAARAKLTAHLAPHRPEKPLRGAVRLLVKWCFPRGASHQNGEYRTSRPDTDNLQKLLKDCMTKCGFWQDDAQVASEICEKFWADIPGLYIRVEEIHGEPQTCGTCGEYAEFEGVCTNGGSEYRAEFREPDDTCPHWKAEGDSAPTRGRPEICTEVPQK